MQRGNFSRRNWLKKASLLTTGLGSIALGGELVASEAGASLIKQDTLGNSEEDFIRLFYNENPYGPPATALAKVMEVANRANRYATFATYDFDALRDKIAEEEGLTKDHVLLGHGSFQPIIWLAEHFIRQGGNIIVPSPTFDIVGGYGHRLGATIKTIEVNENMTMDLVEMERAVDQQTRLVCLCNPNNPTGVLTDPALMDDFCESVSNRCTVLVDEAYLQYVDAMPNWRDASMVHHLQEGRNVVVSRTFSKIYGMAGFRIGYLLGPPDLIRQLSDRFTLGFPGNMPNTMSVAAAMGALEDQSFLAMSNRKNATTKTTFYQHLEALDLPYIPTQANFVYFELPDFGRFKQMMNDNKILLAGGWPTQPNWARVTLGKSEEMDVFYDLLRSEDWR